MADIVDTPTRSRMMAGIRSKHTRPELAVRRYLHAKGLRYRLHGRTLPGSPDLIFPSRKVVVFIHGCFWHRHEGCRFAYEPTSNVEKWQMKFAANTFRDKRAQANLHDLGWRIIIVWECDLKKYPEARLQKLFDEINDSKNARIG